MDFEKRSLWTRPDATASGVAAPRTLPDFVVTVPIEARVHTSGEKASVLDDDGKLWVRALVSTPSIDEQNEIVEASAFTEGMEKFGQRPVMLAFHDMAQPVGLWPHQDVSDKGVYMDGFISGARPDIQRLVLDGVLTSASIGFAVKEGGLDWDDERELLKITALELFEVSLVPLPANLDTFVTVLDAAKSWTVRKSLEFREREAPARMETPEPEPPAKEQRPPASTVALPDVGRLARVVGRVGSVLAEGVGSIADDLD